MPALTKKIISEQVLFRLYGGYPDVSAPVQEEDVWKATEQLINAKYKVEHFGTTLQSGETIPDNLCLAFYEGVAVSSDGDRSYSLLPAMPISLPRSMGVFDIRSSLASFIPLQYGQADLLRSHQLLNDLLGQISYEVRGRKAVYSKDITLLGITTVDMALVVLDMSQYGITDILPLAADFEGEIVELLVKQFSPVMPETGIVQNYTNAQSQITK